MAAFGVAGANAALSPLLSSFGSSMLLNSLLSTTGAAAAAAVAATGSPPVVSTATDISSALQQQQSDFLSRYPLLSTPAVNKASAAGSHCNEDVKKEDSYVISGRRSSSECQQEIILSPSNIDELGSKDKLHQQMIGSISEGQLQEDKDM